MEPLHRSSGYPYRQIEDTIRKIMVEHVGPRRTEHALTRELEKLRRVEHYLDEIRADDLHELMRTYETSVSHQCHALDDFQLRTMHRGTNYFRYVMNKSG